jgi:hypothetical protein
VRQAGHELQRRLPSNALLRGETGGQFATFARSPGAIQRAKSNFPARSKCGRLDIAEKFNGFKVFYFRFAVAGDGRAALCAELRPASLIHPFKRR